MGGRFSLTIVTPGSGRGREWDVCVTHLNVAALQDFLQDVLANEVDGVFEAGVVSVDVVALSLGSAFAHAGEFGRPTVKHLIFEGGCLDVECSAVCLNLNGAGRHSVFLLDLRAFRLMRWGDGQSNLLSRAPSNFIGPCVTYRVLLDFGLVMLIWLCLEKLWV